MGKLRWVSVLATASAAASWLCTAGAWKLYRNHELATNNFSTASDSFLEAQWGFPYVAVPRTENSDGSVSFFFAQAVQGYGKGQEPPETSEGPGSTENAGSDEEPSNAGEAGSTGGPISSEESSGTQGSGEASTFPEHTGGSSGSSQGSASSETVESAPSEGATGNGEASTGSTEEPSSPENGESSNEGAADDAGESTLPEEEVGHEPPETSEGLGSTENAGSDEEPSNTGQAGSTGGPISSEEGSGTQGSGEASTFPEDTGGSSGSSQGSASSETVESAPSEGATGNGEASTGSTEEPSSPENGESSNEGAADDGGESTLPEEEVVEEEEAELGDVHLGPCRFEEMSVTGPGEFLSRDNVQTLQECHEICLKEVKCNWYTYNTPNKKCHLKTQGGPIRHVIGGDITSPKYCDSSCFIKNSKVLGTLIGAPAKRATAYNCHYECHFRWNCYYWSWDSATGKCHLFGKKGFQGKTAARGFVSGPRDGCGAEAKAGGITAIP